MGTKTQTPEQLRLPSTPPQPVEALATITPETTHQLGTLAVETPELTPRQNEGYIDVIELRRQEAVSLIRDGQNLLRWTILSRTGDAKDIATKLPFGAFNAALDTLVATREHIGQGRVNDSMRTFERAGTLLKSRDMTEGKADRIITSYGLRNFIEPGLKQKGDRTWLEAAKTEIARIDGALIYDETAIGAYADALEGAEMLLQTYRRKDTQVLRASKDIGDLVARQAGLRSRNPRDLSPGLVNMAWMKLHPPTLEPKVAA